MVPVSPRRTHKVKNGRNKEQRNHVTDKQVRTRRVCAPFASGVYNRQSQSKQTPLMNITQKIEDNKTPYFNYIQMKFANGVGLIGLRRGFN